MKGGIRLKLHKNKPLPSLPASFTIEAAYVFSIVFFSLAFTIRVAYNERNKALTGFVINEANEKAAHTEAVYDPEGADPEEVAADAGKRFAAVPALRGAAVSIEKGIFKTTTDAGIGSIQKSVTDKRKSGGVDANDQRRTGNSGKDHNGSKMHRKH
jgi:hypothetical protein